MKLSKSIREKNNINANWRKMLRILRDMYKWLDDNKQTGAGCVTLAQDKWKEGSLHHKEGKVHLLVTKNRPFCN